MEAAFEVLLIAATPTIPSSDLIRGPFAACAVVIVALGSSPRAVPWLGKLGGWNECPQLIIQHAQVCMLTCSLLFHTSFITKSCRCPEMGGGGLEWWGWGARAAIEGIGLEGAEDGPGPV